MDIDALEKLLELLECTQKDCAHVTCTSMGMLESYVDKVSALYYSTGAAIDDAEAVLNYLKAERDKNEAAT